MAVILQVRGGLPTAAPSTTFETFFSSVETPLNATQWILGARDCTAWTDIKSVAVNDPTGGAPTHACASAVTTGTNDGIAILKSSVLACPRNQFAEATLYFEVGYAPSGGFHESNVFVLVTGAANSIKGYEWYVSITGNSAFVRWEGPVSTFTPLAAPTPGVPVTGDVMRLECDNAGNFTGKYNGATQFTFNDTTWTTGQPAFGNNPSGTNTILSAYGSSRFKCGTN